MDINDLRGLSTVFVMLAFLALVVWAYSGKRRREFEAAANLPFADEEPNTNGQSTKNAVADVEGNTQ